jgi:hypothetical protein
MGTMGCNEFLNQIESWLDGEHSAGARAHVRDCPDCRGVIDDLGAIQESANAWGNIDPEPPSRIWTSLRAKLEQEGLIRDQRPGWIQGVGSWLEDLLKPIPRPALAGAYLAALVVAGAIVIAPSSRQLNQDRWLDGTQVSIKPLNAALDLAEQDTISNLANYNPVVTASLHKNLAIVDNYIALCEKSVHDEPENELARDYLYQAYQQKADLLAEITEHGDYGR